MFVDLKYKIATFTMSNKKQPPEVFYKEPLLKISQYAQENAYVGVSF